MDRHNYFGAFTESFDRMREELKLSSEREAAANRSKQELVAEISHDIKTPVATIKATCEVMEIKYKEDDIQ
jgi:signal transduction histidine kinase